MFEPEDGDRGRTTVNNDILALLHEHQRLRNDVDRLLAQKQQLLQQKESTNGDNSDQKDQGKDDNKDETKEPPKPPLKDRVKTWTRAHPAAVVLIVAGVALLAVAIFFLMQYLSSYETTDDAQIDGHTNQISSRVSGTVTGVYVEDDRTVSHGQVLVDLDPRDYLNALAQAQANLAQAAAALGAQEPNVPITQTTEATNVATAQLNIATAESALQAARQTHQSALAELEQAKANADNAAVEEVRYRHLAEKEEVSRELYDQKATQSLAQAAIVVAKQASAEAAAKAVTQREAELAQVRDRYREAQTNQPRQVAVQHATAEGRRANVAAARAQLQQAQLNLSYCKITAPVDGIIGGKTVEVGQQISPGEELFAITPTDDIWVTANFKETQLIRMRAGLGVNIHVDAVDLNFNGYVENMPGATGARYSLLPPENATGNYVKVVQRLPVRIRLKPGQPGIDRLRPGMSVEPKVWLK